MRDASGERVPRPRPSGPGLSRIIWGRGGGRGERLAALGLLLLVPGSVLAVGAVHLPVLLGVAALALSAGVLAFRARMAPTRRLPLSLFAGVCAALAAYTLLQTVPLPMSWLEKIAPNNADVWARALLPLGEPPPAWAPISLDPGASVNEALKWAIYGAVFTASAVVSSRRGAAWGVGLVFVSSVLAAFATIAHGLAGATKVFGVYEPSFPVASWHVGPLLNPNNLAGYLNLGVLCGLGLMMMPEPIIPPWVVGLGVATVVGVDVTSGSRGGLVVLPLGIAAFAIVLMTGKRELRERRRELGLVRWLLGGAIVLGATLAVLAGTSETYKEIFDANVDKLGFITSSWPVVRDHAWLGIGRGAFESVFPAYRLDPGNLSFTHAESFPFQWASEWGLPITAIALGAFALALRPSKQGVRQSSIAAGAWIGAMVLALHNLVDLGLEIPALPIAMACALGAVWGGRERDDEARSARDSSPRSRRRVWTYAVPAASLLVFGLALWRDDRGIDVARTELAHELTAAAIGSKEGRTRLRAHVRRSMLEHPADPYFPLVGALIAFDGHDENPMPWIQRSLERGRRNGRAHMLLAQILAGHAADAQELFELRLAVDDDPSLVIRAAQQATRVPRTFEQLASAAPDGPRGAVMLDVMAQDVAKDPALAVRLAREASIRGPDVIGPHWTVGNTLLAAIRAGVAPCDGDDKAACYAEIEQHAQRIDELTVGSTDGVFLRARALLLQGSPKQADDLLAAQCARATVRLDCLRLRVEAALERPGQDTLSAAVKELTTAGCVTPSECADVATWLGDIFFNRKDYGAAVSHYERAATNDPTEARWLKLAAAASAAGAHARAAEALMRVVAKHPADAELKARLDRERALAGSALVPR